MMQTIVNEECRNCKFFQTASYGHTNGHMGFCRRNPPQILEAQKHAELGNEEERFPYTTESGYCGEWKPRDGHKVPGKAIAHIYKLALVEIDDSMHHGNPDKGTILSIIDRAQDKANEELMKGN